MVQPLLEGEKLIALVLERYDESGLRGLLLEHAAGVHELEAPADALLADMDDPADYERQRRELEDGRSGPRSV